MNLIKEQQINTIMMNSLHDFQQLLTLLSVYSEIPSTLTEFIQQAQEIIPIILFSITNSVIENGNESKNLFQQMERNKQILQQCKLLGIEITLTENELTQPTEDVYSQILSLLWQLISVDMKQKITESETIQLDDTESILIKWMNIFFPEDEITIENVQKLLPLVDGKNSFEQSISTSIESIQLHDMESESESKTESNQHEIQTEI